MTNGPTSSAVAVCAFFCFFGFDVFSVSCYTVCGVVVSCSAPRNGEATLYCICCTLALFRFPRAVAFRLDVPFAVPALSPPTFCAVAFGSDVPFAAPALAPPTFCSTIRSGSLYEGAGATIRTESL